MKNENRMNPLRTSMSFADTIDELENDCAGTLDGGGEEMPACCTKASRARDCRARTLREKACIVVTGNR